MFNSADIKWIKSVTRDKGTAWAYMEYKTGDTFELNFSKNKKWYPTNYKKAKPGELIVLFQTLRPKKLPKEVYVTHLLTPLDNNISIDPINLGFPYKRSVFVLNTPTTPFQIDESVWSFFKCSRGQICYINTIERKVGKDFTEQKKKEFIWSIFNPSITNDYDSLISFINLPNNESTEEYLEGAESTKLSAHKFYERDPRAIKQAKEIAIRDNKLFCEACTFDFATTYPIIGDGFIECHHKMHISKGIIRKTKTEDLALVCSNCHRMLHRKNENGEYYTVKELRDLIEQNRR